MQSTTQTSSSSHKVTAAVAENFRVFLFKLGAHSFGLPLERVRYVASMPPKFKCNGNDAQDYFDFQGSPLAYVSLWDELGLKSKYLEYEELLAMLPLRLQDHISWMDALESSILSEVPFTKARDPHLCAFGKWYYGYKAQDPRLGMLLREFEEPHSKIHALADQLLTLTEAGKADEAKRLFDKAKEVTLPVLLKLFADTENRLHEMQKKIVVILTDGNDNWALGADDVSGIVAVPSDQVTQITNKSLGAKSNAASALITLDDKTIVPLLNWSRICMGDATNAT